jgi:hypothetical protein
MHHLRQQPLTLLFIYVFLVFLEVNSDYFLNSVNRLIFVTWKCGVFFAVRTEFSNIIFTFGV